MLPSSLGRVRERDLTCVRVDLLISGGAHVPPRRRLVARLASALHPSGRLPRTHGNAEGELLSGGLTDLSDPLLSSRLPNGAVALTFDDGCLDNLTVASPILQEFDLPATFFITTERLDEKHEFWWDTLERILIASAPLPDRLDLAEDGTRIYNTETAADRADTFAELAPRIRSLAPQGRDCVMRRIVAWAGATCAPRDTHRPMVAGEVVDLSRRPRHTIGAHGVHHLWLSEQPEALLEQEMLGSKRTLERLLDKDVTFFAYPYGYHDAASVELARSSFLAAVTTLPGAVTVDTNRAALPRIDASCLTRNELRAALDSLLGTPASD